MSGPVLAVLVLAVVPVVMAWTAVAERREGAKR